MRLFKKYYKIMILIILFLFLMNNLFYIVNTAEKEKNLFDTININLLENKIKNEDEILVLYFKKDCLPCSALKETLNELNKDEKYMIYAIDIDDEVNDTSFLDKVKIEYTPTFIKYVNGKEYKRLEGNKRKTEIEYFINN